MLRTGDPEKMPLPSRELLEMQWTLHRLSVIAGAAEVYDDFSDNDSDDDGFVPEPVEDVSVVSGTRPFISG